MDNDPNAQGQQSEAVDSDSPEQAVQTQAEKQEAAGAVPEGVQKRFDELTAKMRDYERLYQDSVGTNNQLLAALAQAQTQGMQPRSQEPEIEIDPEEARKLEYIIGKTQAPLMKKIEQLQAQVVQTRNGGAMGEVQAQLQKYNNPALTSEVHRLLKQWEQNGHLQNGVTVPTDALDLALGKMARTDPAGQSRAARERFNAGGAPLSQHGGAASRRVEPRGSTEGFNDMDLNSLSPTQLAKYIDDIESKYPDGVPLK